ncbi:hypothetical protein CEXT_466031 [Caerostris extrusa]|uniref:Uncharacterized protein n=1 Tax=Caerostris extrusa TaxID=172846 RepID=A0AAV4XUB0_CAEEX|nr:hypothetical protein CEXT_466031 [Caerostris extrusa]
MPPIQEGDPSSSDIVKIAGGSSLEGMGEVGVVMATGRSWTNISFISDRVRREVFPFKDNLLREGGTQCVNFIWETRLSLSLHGSAWNSKACCQKFVCLPEKEKIAWH